MSVCKLTGWDGFCVPCAKFFYSKKTQEQHIRMMYYRALTILVKKVQKEFLQLGAQENFGITNRGIFKETLALYKNFEERSDNLAQSPFREHAFLNELKENFALWSIFMKEKKH